MFDGQFYRPQPLQFMEGLLAPPIGLYRANGVNFDGTTPTKLTRGGALTSVADATSFTLSCWLKSGVDAQSKIFLSAPNAVGVDQGRFFAQVRSTNGLRLLGLNSAGTTILDVETAGGITVAAGWVNILASIRMSSTSERFVYQNDVSSLSTITTYTNASIDFTTADWFVGQAGNATVPYLGDMADLMFWPGLYTDFSVAANRRLFIDSVGKPLDPAVAIATLGTPAIRLSGDTSGWPTNKGSGGGFTLSGPMSTATTTPSG